MVIVLNNLHRKKLDLNRTLKKSNCDDMTTEIYWNLFHDKVDNFRNESSVKSLLDKNFDNLKLTDLLSDELSMGSLLTENNYTSVPSKDFIAPKKKGSFIFQEDIILKYMAQNMLVL